MDTAPAFVVVWVVVHASLWLGTGAGSLYWIGHLFRLLHFVELFTWRWLASALRVYAMEFPPAYREWGERQRARGN
jgi:hypothetical protein